LKQFRGLGPDRLFLHAETGPIARTFTRLADREVAVVPWPAAEDARTAASSAHAPFAGKAPTIGYFGYGKAERGIFLLPEIVASVAEARPDARFVVQINSFLPSETAGVADALRPFGERAAIIEGALARDRLMALMAECDVVLMPYDPEPYRERGSGLFGEAIMLGRTVVVPDGTWMAEELAANGLPGAAFDRFEATSVAAAVFELLAGGKKLVAESEKAVAAWVGARTARTYLDAVVASLGRGGETTES
jgi:glycosyltransferase involved in cell wall biosynthesis